MRRGLRLAVVLLAAGVAPGLAQEAAPLVPLSDPAAAGTEAGVTGTPAAPGTGAVATGTAAATPLPTADAAAAGLPADVPGFDPGIVDACLTIRTGTVGRSGCIGVAASRCLDALGPVAEGDALARCYTAETQVWSARLTEALARLSDSAATSDRAEQAGPGSGRRAALEVAQAAWANWRDAECGFARRMAAGGGAERPTDAACLMHLTAERALALTDAATAQEGP